MGRLCRPKIRLRKVNSCWGGGYATPPYASRNQFRQWGDYATPRCVSGRSVLLELYFTQCAEINPTVREAKFVRGRFVRHRTSGLAFRTSWCHPIWSELPVTQPTLAYALRYKIFSYYSQPMAAGCNASMIIVLNGNFSLSTDTRSTDL